MSWKENPDMNKRMTHNEKVTDAIPTVRGFIGPKIKV
jgi:hypothetical protein